MGKNRAVFCAIWCLSCVYYYCESQNMSKRVCVIGAGIAGLSSARYLKEEGIQFTVLEGTHYVGGTWRYEPRVGTDENGQFIHTSMYKHLRTNLPKPTMELRGFPLPKDWPSYPSGECYYQYINDFTKHFDLEKHIKFLHHVVSVKREDNVWKVKHVHIPTETEYVDEYDFVIVGTGHHSKPNWPNIPGENVFKGSIIHSHDYRDPEPYKDRRVLVVGAGPSGMDIGIDIANTSAKLVHSHHSPVKFRTAFPEHFKIKPDILELTETGALFVDGTFEEIDDIVYCTGFQYDYPFLDETCELTLEKRSVIPLYKYLVNINQPTMVIPGLIVRACLAVAIDAQVRYTVAMIKGNFTLPSKDQMMAEWQKHADAIISRGRPMSDIHFLAQNEDHYYAELTKESGIARVPPAMFKIRTTDIEAKLENLYTYRNYEYTIVDDVTFTRQLEVKGSKSSCCDM